MITPEEQALLDQDTAKRNSIPIEPPANPEMENTLDRDLRLLNEDKDKNVNPFLLTEQEKVFSGGTKNFNASTYDKNFEKLQTYSKFNKYGYNPYIDNAKFYNDNLTSGEQWARSFKGAGKLLSIGFTDNALFGAWASDNSDKEYAKIADTYSSTKGGVEGFTQNLVLNAGYTVGIVADMVIEEIALGIVTAATVGGSAPVTGSLMVAKATNSFRRLRNMYNVASDLQKTIRGVNQAKKLSAGKKVLNFFNPVENTTNFVRTLNNAQDLKNVSGTGKLMMGAGSMFRDVKAIHLAHTESKLESNMLQDEVYDDLVKNHQGELTDADAEKYMKQAETAGWWAWGENMVAISATNKLVFNNMYKAFDDLKGFGKTIGSNRFYDVVGKMSDAKVVRKGLGGIGQRTKMMFSDGFGTGVKRIRKNIVSKGGTYFAANIGEGFQENLQEMINAKNMHQYGSEAHGDWFDGMLHGIKEQMTGQGLETFASGFLMGSVVSPVNFTVKSGTQLTKGGGYKYFTDNKGYKSSKTAERNRLESDVKILSELHQNAPDVFKSKGNNLAVQAEMEMEMYEASQRGDQFEFQNAKAKSYRNHLGVAMQYGMMDQFKTSIEQMKTMDAEQFGEAFKTAGSKTTQAQRNKIVDEQLEKAEKFEQVYESVNKNIVNPIQLNKLDKNSPEYAAARQYHSYFERAKQELIFSTSEVDENLKRKKSMLNGMKEELKGNLAGEILFSDYEKLFHPETVSQEIGLLQAEIASIEFSEGDAKTATTLKNKQARLEALTAFNKTTTEYAEVSETIAAYNSSDVDLTSAEQNELNKLEKEQVKAEKQMHKEHNAYLKTIAPKVKGLAFENLSEKSFETLLDSYKLDNRNSDLDFLINVLTNEKAMDEFVNRKVQMHEVFMAQFRKYVENSLMMSRNKEVVQSGLNELYENGLGFNLMHLDALVEKGEQPPAFYSLETGKQIPKNTTQKDGSTAPNEQYTLAVSIVEKMYDKIIDKPTENLKEPTDAEESEASETLEGDKKISNEIGGGADRRDYQRTEADNVMVNEGDSIDSYPDAVVNDLINEYSEQVANEDILDKNIENLAPDNLTNKFKGWVNDSADAERIIREHNEDLAPIPNTFDVLSDVEKAELLELDYTEEKINDLSREEIDKILSDKTEATEEVEVEEAPLTQEEYDAQVEEINKDFDTQKNTHDFAGKVEGMEYDKKLDERREVALKELQEKFEKQQAEEIPDVAGSGKSFDEELRDRRDKNVNVREQRAIDLIMFSEKQSPGEIGSTDYFNRVTAVEELILNNIGNKVDGNTITEEVIQDVYEMLAQDPQFNENILNKSKELANQKVFDYNNPDVEKNKKIEAQSRYDLMIGLRYTKEDIAGFSQETITSILKQGKTKREYQAGLKRINATEVKEIKAILKSNDTNLRTQEEVTELLAKISLENQELFEVHEKTIGTEIEKIKNELANLKGFSSLKEGDVVEMSDGSLMKVDKLMKTKVELVNYNSIVQNKTSMTKAQFNKENKRIVNDFNKDSKGLKSELEKQNVTDLSSLLSSFTNGALTSSEGVPTEQEMKDHFKLCK
jgi:hypothetical protein